MEFCRRLLRMAEDLVYPPRCPVCGEISEGFCRECMAELEFVSQPFCFRCGKPLAEPEAEYCGDCRKYPHAFAQGRSLLVYDGEVKSSLYRIKYGGKREYLQDYGHLLAQRMGACVRRWNPEAVLFVPMQKKAQKKRGFNQAQVLAETIAAQLGLEVNDALCKVRATAVQKQLTRRQRRENLRGAFAVRQSFLDGEGRLLWRTVLLVDDVYTTGSTIDEAAKVLKAHGVERVFFLTLCTGRDV